jgi:hypothetical protein
MENEMSDEKKDLTGHYVSPITRRVETTTGHVIVFPAKEPVFVPAVARPDMFELGILPADGEVPKEMTPDVKEAPPVPVGLERNNQLTTVFNQLVDKNDADDFTATQLPKLAVVKKMAGFDISGNELKEQWKAFKADLNTDPAE